MASRQALVSRIYIHPVRTQSVHLRQGATVSDLWRRRSIHEYHLCRSLYKRKNVMPRMRCSGRGWGTRHTAEVNSDGARAGI